jgi:hypothetical protein
MLTIQFVPYAEIKPLKSDERINKLLDIVKEEKIVVMEGKLKSQEEAELIQRTMESIDDKFKGVEIAVIYPEQEDADWLDQVKNSLYNFLLGDRQGLTIVGPAQVVKEIKQDPEKIQLFTE